MATTRGGAAGGAGGTGGTGASSSLPVAGMEMLRTLRLNALRGRMMDVAGPLGVRSNETAEQDIRFLNDNGVIELRDAFERVALIGYLKSCAGMLDVFHPTVSGGQRRFWGVQVNAVYDKYDAHFQVNHGVVIDRLAINWEVDRPAEAVSCCTVM